MNYFRSHLKRKGILCAANFKNANMLEYNANILLIDYLGRGKELRRNKNLKEIMPNEWFLK